MTDQERRDAAMLASKETEKMGLNKTTTIIVHTSAEGVILHGCRLQTAIKIDLDSLTSDERAWLSLHVEDIDDGIHFTGPSAPGGRITRAFYRLGDGWQTECTYRLVGNVSPPTSDRLLEIVRENVASSRHEQLRAYGKRDGASEDANARLDRARVIYTGQDLEAYAYGWEYSSFGRKMEPGHSMGRP